jgi:hypothetical protein
VQRSLKFEIQTGNKVWAVKNIGDPDPRLLPRKYAATSKDYAEGSGEERGDKPTYLSVGRMGGPARRKGQVTFVKAEGALVTEAAKGSKQAQFVRVYQFKKQAKAKHLLGKRVVAGQLTLVRQTDRAEVPAMAGRFDPNTFEFRYLNPDGSRVNVHLGPDRRFKAGHLAKMKVGRSATEIDPKKAAQFVEIWKVTEDTRGTVEFDGKMAKVQLVSVVNNARKPRQKRAFNPGTWQKLYYRASDIKGRKPVSGAVPLDVHMDTEGRLQEGQVKFLWKRRLAAAKEQTAIEVQSEHGGFVEFETPKWFRDWAELEERLQEAVDITRAMNAQRGTPREVRERAVLDKIRQQPGALGKVVEWPAALSTAHLTRLRADKRRLLVQIVDDTWKARIQASEAIPLAKYGSLLRRHERPEITGIAVDAGDALFAAAMRAARRRNPAIDESRFANLKGFLQLVSTYIARGQVLAAEGKPAKFSFRLMARSNFGSMYQQLLSSQERALFRSMVSDPADPILTELQPLVNDARARRTLPPITLTRATLFFSKKVGTDPGEATFGPEIHKWLTGITKGRDLLSGGAFSGAMGSRKVADQPGDKDFKRAQFEIRNTIMPGGNLRPASEWVAYAKAIFDSALERASDTPDDPTTPTIDESSKTGLKN